MLFRDEKIIDVVEVSGVKNVKQYLEQGWVVLGVVTSYDETSDGQFVYSLGKVSLT